MRGQNRGISAYGRTRQARTKRPEAVATGILRAAGREIGRVRPLSRSAAAVYRATSLSGRKRAIVSAVRRPARPTLRTAGAPRQRSSGPSCGAGEVTAPTIPSGCFKRLY